jgi:S1-C subfamily serine protease
VLGACVALVAVWLVAGALGRVDALRDPLRDSPIIERLNAVIPPAGPLLHADASPPAGDALPRIAGPRPSMEAPPGAIRSDRDVRAAAGSVVKLFGFSCHRSAGSGSGWIARPGIVVTNAHVVAGHATMTAQLRGTGPVLPTSLIWFDPSQDIAILRVPGLERAPALPIVARPKAGTAGAILGFPSAGPYHVEVARLGPTYAYVEGAALITKTSGRRGEIQTTSLIGRARSGNSGGPVVDGRGRVLTMVFASHATGLAAYGITVAAIRSALRRAAAAPATGHGATTATTSACASSTY